jgi:hypothetical protein
MEYTYMNRKPEKNESTLPSHNENNYQNVVISEFVWEGRSGEDDEYMAGSRLVPRCCSHGEPFKDGWTNDE